MGMIVKTYQKQFIRRYDEVPHIHTFTHLDFKGLHKKEISFLSHEGNNIKGGLYFYDDVKEDVLIVFCHGLGGGHTHYMREIEELCRKHYLVLSFDYTGCAESSGEHIRGMTQSLSDLHACMDYISKDEELAKKRIFVIGHSLGGYAAGNILNFCPYVEKVVILSGFVSIKQLMKQNFSGLLSIFQNSIIRYEKKVNPNYVNCSFLDAFQKSDAKVLLIYSKDDPMVKMKFSYDFLKKNMQCANAQFLLVDHKGHNPNYSEDAVSYMNETFASLKKENLKTEEEKVEYMKDVDWWRMTTQDQKVWDKIFSFLKEK